MNYKTYLRFQILFAGQAGVGAKLCFKVFQTFAGLASACRHGEYVKRTNEVFWNKTPNIRLS